MPLFVGVTHSVGPLGVQGRHHTAAVRRPLQGQVRADRDRRVPGRDHGVRAYARPWRPAARLVAPALEAHQGPKVHRLDCEL